MRHCCKFKPDDIYYLKETSLFVSRKLSVGFCPICNKPVAEFEEITPTITLPNGRVLEQVEWEGNEWKPVVIKEKAKGKRTSRKAEFERLYEESLGLRRKERREKIIEGLRDILLNIGWLSFFVIIVLLVIRNKIKFY